MTVNGMESEKDTTGRNLGIVKMVDGVKYIAGRPIIEYGGILPGKYLLGDFNQAANLVDYTTFSSVGQGAGDVFFIFGAFQIWTRPC